MIRRFLRACALALALVALPAGANITFVGAGNVHATSPTVPAGYAASDLLVAVCRRGSASTGWTLKTSSTAAEIRVFWKRAASSEPTPTFTGASRCRVAAFRGVSASGDPFEAAGSVSNISASGDTGLYSGNATSITTSYGGSWILHAVAGMTDDWYTSGTVSTGSGAAPAENAAWSDSASGGVAYAVGLYYSEKAVAGSTGTASHRLTHSCPTEGDMSGDGVLLALRAASCPASPPYPAPQCSQWYCNATVGQWSLTPVAAGSSCNDGNECTYDDVCASGTCRGTTIDCTSTDPCRVGICNGTSTCSVALKPLGTACSDGNPCSYGEMCDAGGQCGGGAVVSCTSDACNARTCNGTAACTVTPRTGSCDDQIACTTDDHCVEGTCIGTPNACGGRGVQTEFTYDASGNITETRRFAVSDDPAVCEKIGNACASVPNGVGSCTKGQCTVTCNAGYALCAGACRRLADDPAACGACGNVCPGAPNATATCAGGTCGLACKPGYASCNGACVALGSDVGNCGACGNACPPTANGSAQCVNGECTAKCAWGYGFCASACVPLSSDKNNCGECGRVCPATSGGTTSCIDGQCEQICSAGYTLCAGACVSLATDESHCGACGNVCPTGGAVASCQGGTCYVIGCPTGYRKCGDECVSRQFACP